MSTDIFQQLMIAFQIFGGLALFLFGIGFLSGGLEKAAGFRMQKMLEKLTSNRVKAAGAGAFITAIIQSSSLMMVTLIGLINAGLLNLRQAVGVILGAEIGTTITAQIVAFNIGQIYFLIIGVGFLVYFSLRRSNYQYIGQAILGFGILFLGMATMSSGLKPLSQDPLFIDTLREFGKTPLLGVLMGAAFTAVIQSSSAMTGLVIAMGMENAITLEGAIALIFGANIGTCITGMIASLGSSIASKRAAVAQVFINFLGVAIFLPFLTPFANVVSLTSDNLPRQIANAHTIFNVLVTLIMFPLLGIIVYAATKIIRGEDLPFDFRVRYLDERLLNAPIIALTQAEKEVKRIAQLVAGMLERAEAAFMKNDEKSMKIVFERETAIDELCRSVEKYLDKIPMNRLNESGFRKSVALIHTLTDIERIADHSDNFAIAAREKIKSEIRFSPQAQEELQQMFSKVRKMYESVVQALNTNDKEMAKEILKMEDEINQLESKFREEHINRLKKGICLPEADVIFTESMRNLERIGDHSDNIAHSILTE